MSLLTKKIVNELSYEIIGGAIEVHKHLGSGLLEKVYENVSLTNYVIED